MSKVKKKMAEYYNMADLFLLPTKLDNLPNVLIEAIACGTPCITFSIGGCGEIITNDINGYCVKPFLIDEFANKIEKCLANEKLLAKLKLQSRETALEKFSLDSMAENYYRLFNTSK